MGPHRDPKQHARDSTGIPSKMLAGRGLGEGSLAKGMEFNRHSYQNASRTEPEESLANAFNSLKMSSKCRQDEDSEVKQPASEIALQIARAKLATGFLFTFVLRKPWRPRVQESSLRMELLHRLLGPSLLLVSYLNKNPYGFLRNALSVSLSLFPASLSSHSSLSVSLSFLSLLSLTCLLYTSPSPRDS